jgi:hypothetical protein
VEVVVPEDPEMKEVEVEWVATAVNDRERVTQVEVPVVEVQVAKTAVRTALDHPVRAVQLSCND